MSLANVKKSASNMWLFLIICTMALFILPNKAMADDLGKSKFKVALSIKDEAGQKTRVFDYQEKIYVFLSVTNQTDEEQIIAASGTGFQYIEIYDINDNLVYCFPNAMTTDLVNYNFNPKETKKYRIEWDQVANNSTMQQAPSGKYYIYAFSANAPLQGPCEIEIKPDWSGPATSNPVDTGSHDLIQSLIEESSKLKEFYALSPNMKIIKATSDYQGVSFNGVHENKVWSFTITGKTGGKLSQSDDKADHYVTLIITSTFFINTENPEEFGHYYSSQIVDPANPPQAQDSTNGNVSVECFDMVSTLAANAVELTGDVKEIVSSYDIIVSSAIIEEIEANQFKYCIKGKKLEGDIAENFTLIITKAIAEDGSVSDQSVDLVDGNHCQ